MTIENKQAIGVESLQFYCILLYKILICLQALINGSKKLLFICKFCKIGSNFLQEEKEEKINVAKMVVQRKKC